MLVFIQPTTVDNEPIMTNVLKIKDLAQCNAEPNLIDKLFV